MDSLNIPRPRRALGVMRRMDCGYPILEAGPSSMTTWLDGYGHEAAIWLGYFNRHGWVAACEWPNGIRAWLLSEKGRAMLAQGENWWRQLSWSQRLYVRFWG